MPSRPAPATAPSVAIVGTGFSGIAAAIKLLEDGVRDVVLLERYQDTGGTWRDNTYPGAACDIPSHLYSLSFEPNPDWSRHYAPQQEIRAYLDRVVAKHGLRERTRFGFDVRAMDWDDATATWTLTAATGETVTADVVINAVGGLKDPAYPSIEGLSSFAGPVLHSARWDHDVEMTGRRVAVIGTGASAIQLVPELAEVAGSLTVVQRTAPWVVPRMDRGYGPLQRAAFRHLPGVRQAVRTGLFVEHELFRHAFTEDHPLNRAGELLSRAHLRRQVPDATLRAKVTPDYTFGCKRVLRSDDYYPALMRPNVEVETAAVARVEPDAIVFTDGRRLEVDVLVLSTGFTVSDPLNGTVVTGRDGADLDRTWRGRPSAHLGVTVAGFPNHFMLLGPNAALGHNSVVLQIESAITLVREAVRLLRDEEYVSIEVTPEAHRSFVDWVDQQHAGSSWQGGCSSWYLNGAGENFTVWPGTANAYRRATRRLDLGSYLLRRRWQHDDPHRAGRVVEEVTA